MNCIWYLVVCSCYVTFDHACDVTFAFVEDIVGLCKLCLYRILSGELGWIAGYCTVLYRMLKYMNDLLQRVVVGTSISCMHSIGLRML